MKSIKPASVGVVMALAAFVGLAGCDRSMDSAKNDTATGADTAERNAGAPGDNTQKSSDASDAAVTEKVKSAILSDSDLKASQIQVETASGVVTLTGSVNSAQLSERANTVVGKVDGVKSVENELQVKTAG